MRALAVLPVLLFHAGYAGFSGGFVGVDVFFVISGYLITTIIISELEAGTFSLVGFYERRARRILPALFAVMFTSLAWAWLFLMPSDLKQFGRSLAAVSVFGSNVLFWRTQGYFGQAAELSPLLHTWSLAVEEQYYVLFPLLLMLCRRTGRRPLMLLLALLAVSSLALAQWALAPHPGAAFFLLPMRGWELLLGALAAFHLQRRAAAPPAALAEACAALGVLLIAGAVFTFDHDTPFPGLWALVPTAGSVLIILFATPRTWTGRWLGSRWLVGIGLVSYSSYLWHQPLLAFARLRYLNHLPEPAPALLIAAALIMGYLTWRLVERPWRNPAHLTRARVFWYGAAGSIFFVSAGAMLDFRDGYGGHYYSTLSDAQQRKTALIAQHTAYDLYDSMVDDGNCQFWARAVSPALERRFEACAGRYGKGVIVYGDSHAMNLFNVMAKARVAPFVVGISQGNCRIDTSKPVCEYGALENFLQRQQARIRVLAYHQTGSPMLVDERGEGFARDKFGGRAQLRVDHSQIADVRRALQSRNAVYPTLWVGPWAEAQIPASEVLVRRAGMNPVSIAAFRQLDQEIAAAFRRAPGQGGVEYLPALEAFAPAGPALWVGDCLLFRDLDHLSRCGEDYLARSANPGFWARLSGQ